MDAIIAQIAEHQKQALDTICFRDRSRTKLTPNFQRQLVFAT
ncbi:hypothetical protein [Roseinatronobacter bogoriensis]|nr:MULTISPECIES: hypothetical protein [Rhodobaca]MBB4208250.1 hypothetical protein [Rhodobaca bogoriensis DSM 18756]TDW38891.1 hypothetical protein LY39_01919 [Rhodobaca barguzinensis]TDY68926.1 hypothetical protein EV660_105183 [Rhodobaca bogoriensis DSM 18756]